MTKMDKYANFKAEKNIFCYILQGRDPYILNIYGLKFQKKLSKLVNNSKQKWLFFTL